MSNTNSNKSFGILSALRDTSKTIGTSVNTSLRMTEAVADNLEVGVMFFNVIGVTAEVGLGKLAHEVTGERITRDDLLNRNKLQQLAWNFVNKPEEDQE